MPSVGSSVKIVGLRELQAKLRKLPDELRRSALEQATRAGAQVLVDAARRRAPNEKMARSVRVVSVKHIGDKVVAIVKPNHPLAHLIEYGTQPHTIFVKDWKGVMVTDQGEFIGKVAHHPGMKARPWFRPALDESVQPGLRAMADVLRAAISEAAR